MNPESNNLPSSPENPSINSGEYVDRLDMKSSEQDLSGTLERKEAKTDNPSSSGISTVLPTVVKNTTFSGVVPVKDAQTDDDDSTILAAKDGDLIEKAWVDKAKKIVDDTRGDPYFREEQVKELKADYLDKRYGRKLGEID
jgi:hypothetical protein